MTRASGDARRASSRRRSAVSTVATGFATGPGQSPTSWGSKWGFHEGNVGGEGEIRTHGTLVQRLSSLGQGVRGGSLKADFTMESANCGASNPPIFGSVATGCCYRLGGHSVTTRTKRA